MKEYIILTIVIAFLIFSIKFLIKGIVTLSKKEELVLNSNHLFLTQVAFLENNLEELEFDLGSKKIEEDEYKSLKDKILNDIYSINKNYDIKNKEEQNNILSENGEISKLKATLNCSSCKKELELDSLFCKYCGDKV